QFGQLESESSHEVVAGIGIHGMMVERTIDFVAHHAVFLGNSAHTPSLWSCNPRGRRRARLAASALARNAERRSPTVKQTKGPANALNRSGSKGWGAMIPQSDRRLMSKADLKQCSSQRSDRVRNRHGP